MKTNIIFFVIIFIICLFFFVSFVFMIMINVLAEKFNFPKFNFLECLLIIYSLYIIIMFFTFRIKTEKNIRL